MSLIDRIHNLTERSEKLVDLENRLAESRRLHELMKDAEAFSQTLEQQVLLSRLFDDQGFSRDVPEKVENALGTLSRLKERFENDTRAEQLTRGRDWRLFKDQLNKVCESAAQINKEQWRRFVGLAYSGQKPNELKTSLALTPENQANLPRYENVYEQLSRYARSLPAERSDFNNVREIAERLTEIYQQFDFDVPESVKRFLKAIGDGGADLGLLTNEVRAWLNENNSAAKYRIVAKGGFQ